MTTISTNALLFLATMVPSVAAFVPASLINQRQSQSTLAMMDPALAMDTFASANNMMTTMDHSTAMATSSNVLSFADQGQNLAGIFFQASLLPYLLFLYFLSFKANRISDLGNFGFQFVLLFVVSTIPSGIISKAVYGISLANVDWLHGGAETLLTAANILIVLGFKEAMTTPKADIEPMGKYRNIALGAFAVFAVFCALGPNIGFEAHSAFLFGAGDLPTTWTASLPWVTHPEPENALSIPTWMIHFSSVFEYLFAMSLVWKYSETTGNEKWKGLTWGMLPLHASGICACTYHWFYNDPSLQFLVTSQAGLTLLGNITCMIAAFRIARSNGWTLSDLNPFPKSNTSPSGLVSEGISAMPLELSEATETNAVLAAKLVALTVLTSYAVKYGSLGLDLPFEPNSFVAGAMIVGFPAITAYQYANLSKESEEDSIFDFMKGDGENKPSLSMDDIKKYGVAGTVAYVLTELAFWIVAFPVASTALYQSTGHWPDVVNDNTDRTAVLAFIFAGANIARALVPLRFGAALALAPWVDENIINRGGDSAEATGDSSNP
ncbi:Protein of unknown function (DUF2499) [Seminavis robusta]|uniref:Uncharacterized protein n=1 Tax=Seminavis robusta TaxID=568900 RepID=A0A9N8HCD7_9STRA|nr:Protein of unknown function (DUF2499) [Seminavis robusta]|eukprot:Sro404_g135970.1 Protein of unknown function (DUF2499) (552) ;mRNA; f:52176-53970